MPEPKKRPAPTNLNNNLISLFVAVCIITVLLLVTYNLNQYLGGAKREIKLQTMVLGSKDDLSLLEERSFWLKRLEDFPLYFPGWLELAQIEKKLGNIGKSNYALIKAHEINPNSEELKSLLDGE